MEDRVLIPIGCDIYLRINMNYGDIKNATKTSGSLARREQRILNYVNFLARILLTSDWFKNNQLLSQLTHAYYRDTVPLRLLSI